MFNYVVKDPDSSRLSGEFWIKDANGLGRICVSSNLVALSSRWKRLPEIARSGPNSTRLHLAQRRLTFSTNFLRVSSFSALVNLLRSLLFRRLLPGIQQSRNPCSAPLKIPERQTAAEHSAPTRQGRQKRLNCDHRLRSCDPGP